MVETAEWAVERMAAAVGEQQKAFDNSQHIPQGEAAEAGCYGYAEGSASPLVVEEVEQKEVYTKFALGKMKVAVVVAAIL